MWTSSYQLETVAYENEGEVLCVQCYSSPNDDGRDASFDAEDYECEHAISRHEAESTWGPEGYTCDNCGEVIVEPEDNETPAQDPDTETGVVSLA